MAVSDAPAEPMLNNASVTDDASNQEGSKNETASFNEPVSKAPGTSEKGVQEALEKSTKTPEIPYQKANKVSRQALRRPFRLEFKET